MRKGGQCMIITKNALKEKITTKSRNERKHEIQKRNLTAENTARLEDYRLQDYRLIFQSFNLLIVCDLCALCGEELVFFVLSWLSLVFQSFY